MEKGEFNAWLERHQTAFPALSDWLASLPSAKGTLELWFDAMRWLDAGHARDATSRMVSGIQPIEQFANWHDTPRFVAEHCHDIKRESAPRRSLALQRIDGEPTYRCRECWATGVVDVYHGRDVAAIRSGRFSRNFVYRAARSCSCQTGKERYKGLIEAGGLPQFDGFRDVALPNDRSSCMAATLDQDVDLIMQGFDQPMTLEEFAQR